MTVTQTELRAVQEYFGFGSPAPVEKDWHVVCALVAIANLDAAPFTLVFGGGTSLARAHKLVRRMSEDVDFKIVPPPNTSASRNQLRQQLGHLREQVTAALHAAGFAFDPANPAHQTSRNKNRYTVFHLAYGGTFEAGEGLRSTIQVELTYAPLRLPPVLLPVSSFVAEAYGRPAEVPAIPCVGLVETAAEKLVSLTRRTAMELAGLSRDPDPALVRHVYDLHVMREHVDAGQVAQLARQIATADAEDFRQQHPAYLADHVAETRKALHALQADPVYRHRYADFVNAMVYGEAPTFEDALGTVTRLAHDMCG